MENKSELNEKQLEKVTGGKVAVRSDVIIADCTNTDMDLAVCANCDHRSECYTVFNYPDQRGVE